MVLATSSSATDKKVTIGIVSFLSGAAADPFGIPARNSAEITIEAINNGTLPAPYNTVGFAGAKVNAIYMDENSETKITDYTKLADKADVIVGYSSSRSCKDLAHVVEKTKRLTVFFDCGTPQIFEDIVKNPTYLFRTTAHATMDSVGAARYLLDSKKGTTKVAGINQNYAWGQDSWRDFKAAVSILNPQSQFVTEQFPELFVAEYNSEITNLLNKKPQAIHSSFWGRDMESFLLQASARNVFSESIVILTTGESAMHRLAAQIPQNTIIGGRGPNGALAPKNALNKWFTVKYFNRFGTFPSYPSYKMIQALLAVKTAYDNTGQHQPSQEAVVDALTGLTFETPSGSVHMALANGHQAIQDTAYGTFTYDRKIGKPELINIKRYKARCVNPPENITSLNWIKSGFKGANCQ